MVEINFLLREIYIQFNKIKNTLFIKLETMLLVKIGDTIYEFEFNETETESFKLRLIVIVIVCLILLVYFFMIRIVEPELVVPVPETVESIVEYRRKNNIIDYPKPKPKYDYDSKLISKMFNRK